MVEIKAGRELDRAVAEVVGVPMPPWASEPYSPSTDLNASFAAAEKVGLFTGPPDVHLAMTKDGRWEILMGSTGYRGRIGKTIVCGEMGYVSREPTPALAICAAILKLKVDPPVSITPFYDY